MPDPCAVDANDPNLAYKFGTMVNETVIAQTFNKDLANEYGKICGNYSLWSNLTIFWGCGTNLHRSPYNARNHEYYSEDCCPYLRSGRCLHQRRQGVRRYHRPQRISPSTIPRSTVPAFPSL